MPTINFPENRGQCVPPIGAAGNTDPLQDGDESNVTADGVVYRYRFNSDGQTTPVTWWKSLGQTPNAFPNPPDKIQERNTKAEVQDSGSDGQFFVQTDGTNRLQIDNTGDVNIGPNFGSPTIEFKQNGSGEFGSGNISLNADGSAKFGSSVSFNTNGTRGNGQNTLVGYQSDGSTASFWLKGSGAAYFNGDVGIGTTTPSSPLHISGDGQTKIILANSTDKSGVELIATDTAGEGLITSRFVDSELLFGTSKAGGAVEHMRLDSSGRLLVGTDSTSRNSSMLLQGASADSTANAILRLSRGETGVANNAPLGFIAFSDSGHATAASIQAVRDGGTWTSGSSQPTGLVFSTAADGDSVPVQHVRIDSSGRLLVGATSTNNTCKIQLTNGGNAGPYIETGNTNRNQNGLNKLLIFRHGYWNGKEEVASIGVNTSSSAAGSGYGTGALVFYTGESGDGDGGSTSTERLRITSDGTFQLRNSPGIDFSQIQTNAAGMTSETLDSYEEGTFTPTINSVTGANISSANGRYTKIGQMVYAKIFFQCNASGWGGATSDTTIGGLPFTVKNSIAERGGGFSPFQDALNKAVNFRCVENTTNVIMFDIGTSTRVQGDDFTGTNTTLELVLIYAA